MDEFCIVRCEVMDDVVVHTEILHASATRTRAEAEAGAEAAAKAHQDFGFDVEGGYWWGRNTGGVTNRFLPAARTEAHRIVEESSSR